MTVNSKRAGKILALGVVLWICGKYVLPCVLPFLLGAGLALAAEPAVGFLTGKCNVPRAAASGVGVSSLFALLCTVLILVFGLLLRELGLLAGILPDMENMAKQGLLSLQHWLSGLAERCPETVRGLVQRNLLDVFSSGSALLDRFTKYALGLAGSILSALPNGALGMGTGVLSAFLISAKLPVIRQQIQTRIPAERIDQIVSGYHRLKETVGLWLLAQLKLIGINYGVVCVGFLILKIDYGPLWALGVAAVDAFPILGTGTVLVPWSVVCLLQGRSGRAMGLLGLYMLASVIRSVLEPRFVGKELGLDPLVTLIALYAGFRLWGFAGMILSPLLAMTVVKAADSAQNRNSEIEGA